MSTVIPEIPSKSNGLKSASIGAVRLSYAHLTSPYKSSLSAPEAKPKYSAVILLPKTNTQAKAVLDKAIQEAITEGNPKWSKGTTRTPGFRGNPVKDGDAELNNEGEPKYPGFWYFNVSSNADHPPKLYVREDGQILPILEDSEIYSGCWCAISVRCYGYSAPGNNGISININNCMKVADDDRLGGGGSNAESDFAGMF